jgi:hypothetical protein
MPRSAPTPARERVATTIAKRTLNSQHRRPVTAFRDSTAPCTRVDMAAGGSILVTLRGPSIAMP